MALVLIALRHLRSSSGVASATAPRSITGRSSAAGEVVCVTAADTGVIPVSDDGICIDGLGVCSVSCATAEGIVVREGLLVRGDMIHAVNIVKSISAL